MFDELSLAICDYSIEQVVKFVNETYENLNNHFCFLIEQRLETNILTQSIDDHHDVRVFIQERKILNEIDEYLLSNSAKYEQRLQQFFWTISSNSADFAFWAVDAESSDHESVYKSEKVFAN